MKLTHKLGPETQMDEGNVKNVTNEDEAECKEVTHLRFHDQWNDDKTRWH